jgi:hypothetical protein
MKQENFKELNLVTPKNTEEPHFERLAISVPEAGELVDIGRSAAYDAAKRGDFPTIRVGGRLLVPLKKFQRMFE